MSKSNKAGYDITRSPFAPNLLFNFDGEGSGGIYIPSVTAITGGYRLSWTNDAGLPNPDPIDIMNGTNGTNGQDGEDGEDGQNGATFTPAVTEVAGGVQISWTNDAELPNPQTVTIYNGTNGTDGTDGTNGVTFTPTVTAVTGGIQISWTNDGGLPNPQTATIYNGTNGTTPIISMTATVGTNTGTPTVNIIKSGTDEAPTYALNFDGLKGETGAAGADGQDGSDGISPTITARSITGGTQIEIVSAGGTERFDVMNGTDGTDGTTPVITMTATVGTNTGTPSVQVTQTGTAAAPNINLAFDGLKGESGGGSAKDPLVQNVKYTNGTVANYASPGNVALGTYTFLNDKLTYGFYARDSFVLRLPLASSLVEDIKALTSVILVTLAASGTVKRTLGTSWVEIVPIPIAINPGVSNSSRGYCLTKAFRFGDYMVSKCISPGLLGLRLAPTAETSTALSVQVPYYVDIVLNNDYVEISIKSDELKRAFEIITQGDATKTSALMAEMEAVWDSDWQQTYTNEGQLKIEFRGQI